MELIIKDVEGKRIKCNAKVVEIVGKDSDRYRIQQDYQRGIEVTGEGIEQQTLHRATMRKSDYHN